MVAFKGRPGLLSQRSCEVDSSPSAGVKSGISTAQYRHFKPFGEILVAKALAISIVGSPKAIKAISLSGRNSQFPAIVGNLAPCEACIRRSHSCEREALVFFGARTLDPLADLVLFSPSFELRVSKDGGV